MAITASLPSFPLLSLSLWPKNSRNCWPQFLEFLFFPSFSPISAKATYVPPNHRPAPACSVQPLACVAGCRLGYVCAKGSVAGAQAVCLAGRVHTPVAGHRLPVHSPLAVCSDTAVCLDAQTACAHASPRSHETMRRVGAGCVASAADARVVRSMFAAGGADPLLSFCPVACYPRVRTFAGGGVFQVRGPAHGLRSAAGGGSGRGQ